MANGWSAGGVDDTVDFGRMSQRQRRDDVRLAVCGTTYSEAAGDERRLKRARAYGSGRQS
jgi:hypothetical protein